MVLFWVFAALMTLAALAFVLVPLLGARPLAGRSAAEANLEVLRGQRREIEADVAAGTLPADAREEAMAELVERARDDLSRTEPTPPAAAGKPWGLAAGVALAIPALAFGIYLATGSPAASDSRMLARDAPRFDDQQIVAMVENLARKVRERPGDAQGWALLARSMAALGRFRESAQAYERLVKLVPRDPQVLADYADALGMSQGRTLAGRPFELVKEALAIDPKHPKALALAGTAALDSGDYASATRYWETLAAQLPRGSDDEAQVRALLAEVRQKADAASRSVSGSVSVAPEVAARVSGTETLFVFARAAEGPRMPLAIMRGTARELPLAFALDDTMAMSPATRLSLAQAVRIEARISKSGNAMPQPGDLVGTSEVVKPGARGVKIVVDKVLP